VQAENESAENEREILADVIVIAKVEEDENWTLDGWEMLASEVKVEVTGAVELEILEVVMIDVIVVALEKTVEENEEAMKEIWEDEVTRRDHEDRQAF